MDAHRARELTGGCVVSVLSTIFGPKYVPLPEVQLHELLEANRIVEAMSPTENGDGTKTLHQVVDPRCVALHYAFEHYGRSPKAMLEALGFSCCLDEEES
jgi:hypothetical protein